MDEKEKQRETFRVIMEEDKEVLEGLASVGVKTLKVVSGDGVSTEIDVYHNIGHLDYVATCYKDGNVYSLPEYKDKNKVMYRFKKPPEPDSLIVVFTY